MPAVSPPPLSILDAWSDVPEWDQLLLRAVICRGATRGRSESLGGPPTDASSTSLSTVTPGVPGDSGSAFLDPNGRALGPLSTISIAPLPASNNIGDIDHELNYAKANSGISGLTLSLGNRAVRPDHLTAG